MFIFLNGLEFYLDILTVTIVLFLSLKHLAESCILLLKYFSADLSRWLLIDAN